MSNLKRYKCSFLFFINIISHIYLDGRNNENTKRVVNVEEKERKNREEKIQKIKGYIRDYRQSENIPKRVEMLSNLYKIYTDTTSIYIQQSSTYNLIFSNALILQVKNFNAYWLGAILKMILYHHPGLLFSFLFISKQIILTFIIFCTFVIGALTGIQVFNFFIDILSLFGTNISFLILFEGIIFNIIMCKIFFCLAKLINIYTQKNRIDLQIGNYERNVIQFLIIILYIYQRNYIDNLISQINIVKLFVSYDGDDNWFMARIMDLLQEFTMIVTIVILLYCIKVIFDGLITYVDENSKINYDKIFVYLELINVADLTKFGENFLRCTIYASFFLIISMIMPIIFGDNNTILLSIFIAVLLFMACESILEQMISVFLKSLLPNEKDTISIPKKPEISEAKPDANGNKTPEDIKKEKESIEEYNTWRKKYYYFYLYNLNFGVRKTEYLKIGDFFTALQSVDTEIIKTGYNPENVKFIENLYKLAKEDKYNDALKEMHKEIDKDGLCFGDDNMTEDEQSEIKDCFQFLLQEIANKSTGNQIDYNKLKNTMINIIKDYEEKKSFVELLDAINEICEKKYSNILPPFYPANTGNYIHIVHQFMEAQYIQTLNTEKVDVFIPSDVLQKSILNNINRLKELEIIIMDLENEFKQYHKDFQQISFIINQTLKDIIKNLESDSLLIENRYDLSLFSRLFVGLETIELKGNEIRVAGNGRVYKSRVSPKRLFITSIILVILSGVGFVTYNNLKEENIEDLVEDLWF